MMPWSELGEAVFSPDRRYRYRLTRERIAESPDRLAVVMLNPSTADHEKNDPTLRRVVGFARGFSFGAVTVVNLYGYRNPYPHAMWTAAAGGTDIVGPENDEHIARAIAESVSVLVAWGRHAKEDRVEAVRRLLQASGKPIQCLGVNGDGSPRHPLRLPKSYRMEPWA